jgi:DNA-binding NtrC family response regulator
MPDLTQLLLVDDDPGVVLTLKAVLEREKCIVQTGHSPDEVNDLLERGQFHVAVVDLRLGPANGLDVLKTLSQRQPDCAPIVLTGYGSLESSIAAMRLGVYDYLLKPTNLEELKQAIRGARRRADHNRACRQCLEALKSN